MKVQKAELFHVDLPFRFSFKHAAAERTASDSIFVKFTLADGTTGWGEGLPRPYVTGETIASSLEALRKTLIPLVLDQDLKTSQDVINAVNQIHGVSPNVELDGKIYFGAARCALELALLDAASRMLKVSVGQWLGPIGNHKSYATAVIPEISPGKLLPLLWLVKLIGFKAVKVKVGTARDEESLKMVRKILGPKIPLIVDANGAWQSDETIENLNHWKKFNITLVEQPVAPRDFAGMRRVREATGLDIMADESLRSMQDAEGLIRSSACTHFHIRLSKCGGLFPSWKILKLARAAGIRCQLGCQVGESSLLAAAGRSFAGCAGGDIDFYEGGYGRLLLQKDVAEPAVKLGFRGAVSESRRENLLGLGVDVNEALLKIYARPT